MIGKRLFMKNEFELDLITTSMELLRNLNLCSECGFPSVSNLLVLIFDRHLKCVD